ncbi:MAG: acyl-CoA dehydrogenase family protein [Acidimicrobiia bacterium]|nr:acyl-CoA dehydrogenase family protein [Acidimicrobiia bacterium]
MDLSFSPAEEAFRAEARDFLETSLGGDFAVVRGRGGPGDEDALFEERLAWERHLGASGWNCLAWPEEYGGADADLNRQVIWYEEYARARAPGRLGHIGEGLAGPTIIAFGTDAQKERFLPPIVRGEELWAQGYSEPDAGSDLANVQARAVLDGDAWVISGQKVWTSGAHWADWAFVLCRTDPAAPRHRGISYLLVPMRQDSITIRPIVQLTGTSEFNEVFFDGARTDAANVVGEVDGGWKVAMGTLAFERGASTLGQQLNFANELDAVVDAARQSGRIDDPSVRQRLTAAWAGLRIMRFNTLRMLSGMQGATLSREAMIAKLYWATWHRNLGALAVDVLGPAGQISDEADGMRHDQGAVPTCELGPAQRLFLWTRSDTIYGGTNQIQRNIIGERALGLPRE